MIEIFAKITFISETSLGQVEASFVMREFIRCGSDTVDGSEDVQELGAAIVG